MPNYSSSFFKGNVFEKAGITAAIIYGKLPPQAVKIMTAKKNDFDPESTMYYSVCKYFYKWNNQGMTCHIIPYEI